MENIKKSNDLILIVPQGNSGGIYELSKLLQSNLNTKNYSISIAPFGISNNLQKNYFRYFFRLASLITEYRKIKKIVRNTNPQVCILAGILPTIFFSRLIKRYLGSKVVFWEHGPQRTYMLFKHIALKLNYKFIDFIVSISEESKIHLLMTYPFLKTHNIEIIHNGVDIRIFNQPINALQFEGKILKLLSTSRLDLSQKDFYTLLKAIALAANAGLKIHLDIAGNGPDESKIKSMIHSLNLKDCVTLIGHQYTPSIIGNYNILVLSSNWEGLPMSLLEGMAAGLLCVASDVSGNNFLISDRFNGLLFRHGDYQHLYDILTWVYNNPVKCREYIHNAKTQTLPKYNLRNTIHNFDSFFNKLLISQI